MKRPVLDRLDDVAVHALVVAAGGGSRFGASTPKQYLITAGRTILEHSVARLAHSDVSDITLVVADGDATAKHLSFGVKCPLYFAVGGQERFLSVKAGVEAIKGRGASDNAWVLIHDAARPCLPFADLSALIGATKTEPVGVILATPVVDTLKFVQDHTLGHTLDRTQLWQAQTPQMFRLGELYDMLEQAHHQGWSITDEASGFELLGKPIRVIKGSRTNIKLTYPEDLVVIETLLKGLAW